MQLWKALGSFHSVLLAAHWIPAWVVAAWSEVLRYSVRILACVQLSVRVCVRYREGMREGG